MPSTHAAEMTATQRVERRREEIVRLAEQAGIITVHAIAERYGVSPVTARSDLDALESRGRLRRVRGGAMPLSRMLTPSSFERHTVVNVGVKRRIARAAASQVNEGETLFVDAGTTTLELMRNLVGKPGIVVITHDSVIGRFVMERMPQAELVIAGGRYRKEHGCCAGPTTMSIINKIFADKAFVGADSFAPEQGFMCGVPEAADVKSGMLRNSERSYILMDSSKFGLHNYLSFATLSDVDCIITEEDPDERLLRLARAVENPPELVIA